MKKKKKHAKVKENLEQSLPEKPHTSSPPPSAFTDKDLRKKVINSICTVIIIFFVVMVMIWGRTYYSQQKFFKEAETALLERDYKAAITGYEWTIRMYTPFSSKVDTACKRLWEIGLAYEKNEHIDWALITHRSLRSSIIAIKSFYSPYDEWIPRTENKIKLLLVEEIKQKK